MGFAVADEQEHVLRHVLGGDAGVGDDDLPEAAVVVAATTAPSDPDDAVISAAMTAHIDSVVNDARRNIISNSR